MKLKVILSISILLILFIVILHVILLNTFPSLKDPYGDDWYFDMVDQLAIDYLKKAEKIDEELHVVQYHYSNYDQNTVIQNRNREDKKYPFEKINVIVVMGTQKYTVYIYVDEGGQLQVEKYERGAEKYFI